MNQTHFGPYSPIRQAGSMYFVSGQVGVDPATKDAMTDVVGQTNQALTNLDRTLKTQGLSLKDVVKTTVFLTDMADFEAMNDVYVSFFDEPRPARSCVAVAELPRVARDVALCVEIEATAYKGGDQ